MKIGIIQAQIPAIHSFYYFSGMALIKDLQIISNQKLLNATISNIEDIENDNTLDYVLYDWNYINKEKKNLNAKAKIITFMGGDKIYWTVNQDFLNKSFLCFKSACPKDLEILQNESKRIFPFHKKGNNLSNENLGKIKPLMYTSAINMNFQLYPFTREIIISFIGSVTSWNRIQVVKILKDTLKNDFYGGFVKDTRGVRAFDESGSNIAGIDISQYQFQGEKREDFIRLIRRSIINLSPSGWGASTHRWVEIMCSGGFCLNCDLSHINYGIFSPKDGIHYISYKNDMSDLIEKVEYFKKNPEKAEDIGNIARKFMEETYLRPDIMAKEYILKYL
jgi:hypothetical protein